MKKLFLLDAMALIYRAHFAFSKNPRITSKGFNTGAIYGFTNSLLEVLEKQKPSHIGVAFDTPEPTFRHLAFEAYKAQREQQPEDISAAIPYIYEIVKAFNIPILVKPGYEADDIIGTIAKKASINGDFQVYMMTIDKDYGQLVEENIFLYKPAYMGNDVDILGVKEILAKWEITEISQVTDILGLQGDAVDNIPGIPGIGEKTAKKLIQEFGSVENLIKNADKLKGKLKENIENFAEQGLLSKQLATIDIEVPIAFEEDRLIIEPVNSEKLKALFDELEFRTISKRVFKDDTSSQQRTEKSPVKTETNKKKKTPAGQMDLFGGETATVENESLQDEGEENESAFEIPHLRTAATTSHDYYLIDTPVLRKKLIEQLGKLEEFCFDTETTSLDVQEAELVGLSISWYATEAYYIPFPREREAAKAIIWEFKEIFENKSIRKIGQNIKYDLAVLKNYEVDINGEFFDTMLAHYLLEPDTRHNMDILAKNYLQYEPIEIETLIGKKGIKQGSMRDVPIEEIKEYAAEDADITYQLKKVFEPVIKKRNLDKLLYEVEGPLVTVLAEMERLGVKIDTAILKEVSKDLTKDILALEKEIFSLAGQEFNIASPKQLGDILFDKLKLDEKAKKTKTGQYATGEEILSRLTEKHPIIFQILEYRELVKLKNTYIDALPELVSKHTGKVHTSYNQAVAATGRLSSTSPNLQNIPIRTEKGREIRKAFVSSNPDYLILSADYSQIELRIMAELSQDETMIKAFRDGKDIHTITAGKLYKVELDQVTSDMRRKAKTANFGIIYGISAHGLSQRLNIPRKEAAEIINNYFIEFPTIKAYMDEVVNKARKSEYVETILGRRRYLPNINSNNQVERGYAERNAINAPIQGSAADMIKIAMIRIHEFLKKENLRSKMILQVHDELIFEVHKEEIEIMKTNIAELMKNALPLSVPMEIGIGVGENWLEAH